MKHPLRLLAFALAILPLTALAAAPTIQNASPPAGSTVTSLSQVTVTFSEAVTGVEAEDFLINGVAATLRNGSGTTWTFSFTQPAPGLVQFSWDGSHAIYNLTGNRFDEIGAGATWNYTLVDTIAPTMTTPLPVPGAVIATLTQVQVTFRESVTGVHAADLLVNDQPATSVSGGGAGPYLFSLTQPSPGSVTVRWAVGHGIVDTAATPNSFAGGSWTYTLNPSLAPDIVINEVMAENLNGLADENGDTSDWIELFNRGNSSVNLSGWSLTDDVEWPGQWVLPAITLNPGQYLVIFASGKDRTTTGPATNHASFVLASSEYLGLYNAELPRRVVSEFAPAYPEQRGDVAWGRTSSNTFAHFAAATPGAPNSSATTFSGFVAKPHASTDSGLFSQPFNVTLSCDTLGAEIYYTLNGDIPSPTNGVYYTGMIPVSGTSNRAVVTLRAAAYQTGLLPSSVLTRTYIFPDQVIYQPARPAGFPTNWISEYPSATVDTVGDYEMDPQVLTNGSNAQIVIQALRQIPTISLVTTIDTAFAPTNGVYSGRRKQGNQRPVNAEMILPDGTRVFQEDCGFEIQGGTSPTDSGGDWKDKKLSMRLLFKGDFGAPKLEAKVFEDSPLEEFDTLILDAGLNWWWTHMTDATQRERAKFITDTVTSDLMNTAGLLAQHTRYVHVYLNGLYWGLYFMHERMDASAMANYFGGQKAEWDGFKHTGDLAGLQDDLKDTRRMTNYQAMFTTARSGITNNVVYERLQTFLDVPWFADYMIVNFWVGNDDWPHHNWYAWRRSRTPNSMPWRFVSWDAEHSFKAYNFNVFANANLSSANSPGELIRLLTNNVEFRVLFGDRVHKHMFNGGALYSTPDTAAFWTPTNPAVNLPGAAYRKRVDEIWNSIVCESARWGDIATPNINNPYTRDVNYLRELNAVFNITNVGGVVNYFPLRGSNVLAQFRSVGLYPSVSAPAFSKHGGNVPAGYSLYMTNVGGIGTVYYTTNGIDPRVYGSGAVSAQAIAYSGVSVSIDRTTLVMARTFNGTNWSALNEATFSVAELVTPLRITELMYNPSGGDAYEFLELQNTSALGFDLGGYYFEGIAYTFPGGSFLPAGARLVLASSANPAAFSDRYPGVSVFGYYGNQLSNGGEPISLNAPGERVVYSVSYDDENGWPTEPDGNGPSLEIIDVNGDPDDPANWRASAADKGTPGAQNSSATTSMRLNEVMADNGVQPDWIELYNNSGVTINVGDWSIADASGRRFVLPTTNVAAGNYVIVYCSTGAVAGLNAGFELGRVEGSLFLHDAANARVDAVSWGNQITGLSIGRTPADEWALLSSATPGAANSSPATLASPSDLSINEWLANAPAAGSDWIEIYNKSLTVPADLRTVGFGTSNDLFKVTGLSFVAPRGFVQLFADEASGHNHLDFKLEAAGDSIVLYDAVLTTEIERVAFGLQVESISQGRFPDGSANIVSFPGTVSPGTSNYVNTYTGPHLNELLARNQAVAKAPWGNYADWLEIYNPNPTPFNLGGFGLSDSAAEGFKWAFPFGVSIPGNSYLVVWCDDTHPASSVNGGSLNTGFNLSGESGGVYLTGLNGQTLDSIEYGVQVRDLSIGKTAGQWRLLTSPTIGTANSAAAALGLATGLRINEWMADAPGSDDWFELFNTGALPVNLTGLYVTDDLSIPGQTLSPIGPLSFIGANGFALFNADGNPGRGRHHANFNLNARGETIRLYSSTAGIIDTVYFGAQESDVSEGRLPDGESNSVQFWTTASPDESNYLPLRNVVINELLSAPGANMEDAVELINTTSDLAQIGGWYLSDSAANLKKYRIADGTSLMGHGFEVFYEQQLNGGTGSVVPFTLDALRGEGIYLSEADGAGVPTGYRAQFTFGAATNGASFGRYSSSIGEQFATETTRTFGEDSPTSIVQFRTGAGKTNTGPLVGPLVINEIMYHPDSLGDTNDNVDDEYVEIYNLGTNAIPLYDAVHATNTWRIRGGIEFDFPSGVTLGSRSFLLLVNFNPSDANAASSFRARYGLPGGVPLFGPYGGRLDNAGEELEFYRPLPPAGPGPDAGFVAYTLVERVAYDDDAPWAPEADGLGQSLQRRRPHQFGNDPVNWQGAVPTPGRANILDSEYADTDGDGIDDSWEQDHGLSATNAGDAEGDLDGDGRSNYEEYLDGTDPASGASRVDGPVITTHPNDQTLSAGMSVSFSVGATGTELNYQWRRNGHDIAGATNATYLIGSVQAPHAGEYSAIVYNRAGFAQSRPAQLTVIRPIRITQQPQAARVNPSNNVTFVVGAIGTGTLRYQWLSNGVDIANATNSSLTLTNVQLEDSADYRVRVEDDISMALSDIAALTVLVRPTFTQHPIGVTVGVGQAASLTVSARGTWPISYRWRRASSFVYEPVIYGNTSTYAFLNVQTNDANLYTVVLQNTSGQSGLSSNAYLVVVVPPTNEIAQVGSDVTFRATAVGRPQNRFQWSFGVTPLPNETNATLVLTNVQTAQAGTYSVVVTPTTNTIVLPATFSAVLVVDGGPRLTRPRLLPDGTFSMVVEGQNGTVYQIERSSDLTNWNQITTLTATNRETTFIDAGTTNRPQWFYRTRR